MYVRIKHDLMPLLYTSGDIDNKSRGLSKSVMEKIDEYEIEINRENLVNKNRLSVSVEVCNRKVNVSEMIPMIKNEDRLFKAVVELKDIDEVSDEMLRIPLAELKLYAYIYMKDKNIEDIETTVVFQNLNDYSNTVSKTMKFTFKEIEEFFISSLEKYFKWIELTEKWAKDRNISIKSLKFPFSSYREGQEKLARSSYITIKQKKQMFVQAPTGVGKTISTIFPAIKAVGENHIDKIFYLTAKTIGAKVAEESFDKMREQGLKFRNITLTAKEKVCFKGKVNCNPISCEYARNYYGKVNDVIYEILQNESTFTREMIEKYARKYEVCPFELSLDLSLYSDAVICDYNYVFDPNVYLKRYFESGVQCNCTFLIDEAHNLVDRARSMYSAEINKKVFINALENMKDNFPGIKDNIQSILSEIAYYEDKCVNGEYSSKDMPNKLANAINKLSDSLAGLFNRKSSKDKEDLENLVEIYTLSNHFVSIAELFDDSYVFYMDKKDETIFKLFCIDPSNNLSNAYKRGESSIIFSATLSPMAYFRDTLGGSEDCYGITLKSPFDINNRELIVADNISTRYKDREKSYDQIVEHINSVISGRTGNYMVFLPSFDYMNKIKDKFNQKYPMVKTIKQENTMSEIEREVYLSKFENKPKNTLVSFNVISGIFSEGIDFKGDKLIGSIIVGVGLPMICLERNVIKDYFQKKNGYGFDFSYTFPGFNRVVQSAGRVIRTDNDKGIIMLIDDRFGTNRYKSLFPVEWSKYSISRSPDSTKQIVEKFWKDKKES